MSTGYSAHPDLASEQLRYAESSRKAKMQFPNNSPQRRRHNSAGTDAACPEEQRSSEKIRGIFFNFSPFRAKSMAKTAGATTDLSRPPIIEVMTSTISQKTLPDRTCSGALDVADNVKTIENTKDCVDCAPPSSIPTTTTTTPVSDYNNKDQEPDQLQQRLSRSQSEQPETLYNRDETDSYNMISSKRVYQSYNEGFISGLSSGVSSPSPSTVSSPLSTPTRLTTQLQHSHQHCCRKSIPPAASGGSHYQHHHLHQHSHQHQHHHHHHHHHHQHQYHHHHLNNPSVASAIAGGCKKLQKFDTRFGPSPYRQLLPIILCILSFATVFTILIIYMDTTEIRHQQFRLNMSRDYDLYGVAQDDPTLIAFLREIHMRKYPMHFLKNHGDPTSSSVASSASASSASAVSATGTLNLSAHHDGLVPEMAHYVADLVGGKVNGAAIQSLTGAFGHLITAPWLAETLDWAGIIVEPEPRRYFSLRKQNAYHAHLQVVHACVSPNPYPKEVTIHNEESEVRINSLLDEETSWFNSRVKCFPLYTIMLACNRVEYDLLSLGVHGHELEILQTLPFEKVKIEVISIHLPNHLDKTSRSYIETITKFLTGKGYKLQKTFGSNYFYQRINTANRTRKKDILLLKTP